MSKTAFLKRNAKKTVCMPTHLSEDVAEHIARQAYERGWSNSQYLRFLAIEDKKRCDDDHNLMVKVSGHTTERLNPIGHCVHCERNSGK